MLALSNKNFRAPGENNYKEIIKSVSMRKPGRTRQEVIQLKSPISLKLGINVRFGE